jgi:hypothetical protein
MENEHDNDKWATRADAFKKAEKINRDEPIVPSKWRLVQYALSRPQAAFSAVRTAFSLGSQQESAGKKGEDTADAPLYPGPGNGAKSTGLLKRLRFWRREKACVV